MTTSILQKANIIGGGFQDASGRPLSLGYLLFKLNHDSNLTILGAPTGAQVTAGVFIKMYLDVNGNLWANQYLWTNDLLTPSGSYYTVNAYNSQGIQVWANPQVFYIEPYAATIDIGTLTPQTP